MKKENPLLRRGFHMRGGGCGAESNICRYKSAKHFPTRNKIKVKKLKEIIYLHEIVQCI